MLTHIYIENYTIIDTLELDFQSGMTVLTGETGAGKSIIIDALDLALGGRTDSTVIRPGSERCEIIASFDITRIAAAREWLHAQEFEDSTECFLKRIISSDGRSKCYLNGKLIPLQLLRAAGELLVNIHGQHQHQTLLQREEQRRLLDIFANHLPLVEQVASAYHEWHHAAERLKALENASQEQNAKVDLLRYQIQELDELGLTENELEELEKEHKQLANADNVIEQYQQIISALAEEDNGNTLQLLHHAQHLLTSMLNVNEKAGSISELLTNAGVLIQEAVNEIKHYLDKTDINPERLHWVEQRLQKIYDTARKHRLKPDALFAHHQQLQREYAGFSLNEEQLIALKQHIETLYQRYLTLAEKLSHSRQKAAKQLSQQVTASIQQLAMPGGQFSLRLEPCEKQQPSAKGLERVEFTVSTNPGQPQQPLSKVVSGGELSRISLAIQVITAQQDATPTLIFDEVDVGIGGSTAAIVGQLLRQLGAKAQVLCITHLAQVAACGHHHYQVKKATRQALTYTQISILNQEQKIAEIARMLGGLKITEQTLAHAKEMYEIGLAV